MVVVWDHASTKCERGSLSISLSLRDKEEAQSLEKHFGQDVNAGCQLLFTGAMKGCRGCVSIRAPHGSDVAVDGTRNRLPYSLLFSPADEVGNTNENSYGASEEAVVALV